MHVLFSKSKTRSLCRIDLLRGQAGWINNFILTHSAEKSTYTVEFNLIFKKAEKFDGVYGKL